MSLFQVEGWNLKSDNVALDTGISKKEAKKSKKEAKEARRLERQKEDDKTSKKDQAITTRDADDITTRDESGESNLKKRKIDLEKEEDGLENVTDIFPISNTRLSPLQQKMMAKLSGSRFRWINEQLYTISSDNALKLIKEQPLLFDEYHKGFKSQVESWPENPVNVFVKEIERRATERIVNAPGGLPGFSNKKVVIADMGCGEAQLALDVNKFVTQYNSQSLKRGKQNNKKIRRKQLDIEVRSFDLKKVNDRIEVADIKNVPMPNDSCTIVVFCLALMGTNFLDFIKEAYRILAPRGELWIAEIKSRFTESSNSKQVKPEEVGSEFIDALKLCGFFHKATDNTNKMFTRFEFFKPPQDILAERRAKLERKKKFIEQETEKETLENRRSQKPEGEWLLKPCIYKRR
ncbi:uncharacterized protein PRCAT00003408001 [Priceomyces carsonii]|uniref:uncharacterized protein n=1 Tax=Priceomyces carsonii TaxID=28549 RepID=UPI002ED86B3F|nr:unnamed protein product [Priceomyces carsonii]